MGNAGVNPSGDATANDIDPEGDPIAVVAFRTGTESGSGTAGSVGSALTGTYGALTLNANGTYTYVVDNNNAAVQALRTAANTLSETFTYQIADNATTTETDLGQIVITIEGRNDNPVGLDDSATAVEAGGLSNAVSGTNPTGNVLTDPVTSDTMSIRSPMAKPGPFRPSAPAPKPRPAPPARSASRWSAATAA
jgi:VCBS repeat-containing protein